MDPATGRGLPLTPGVAMLSFARTTRIVRIVRLLRLVRMCLDMIPWEKVISPPGLRNKDGKGKTKIYQQKEKRVAIISLRSMLVYLYGGYGFYQWGKNYFEDYTGRPIWDNIYRELTFLTNAIRVGWSPRGFSNPAP